jgi:AhpD family alkylhydroperoxidase
LNPRIAYAKVAPEAYRGLLALEEHVRAILEDRKLQDLIYLRVSQVNGCAFCVEMHTRDLRAAGETDERLDLLVAWRDTPLFTAREQAALAWAEAVTELGREQVPDAVFTRAREHFADRELVELTLAIATINAWNRLNIAFRSLPARRGPA